MALNGNLSLKKEQLWTLITAPLVWVYTPPMLLPHIVCNGLVQGSRIISLSFLVASHVQEHEGCKGHAELQKGISSKLKLAEMHLGQLLWQPGLTWPHCILWQNLTDDECSEDKMNNLQFYLNKYPSAPDGNPSDQWYVVSVASLCFYWHGPFSVTWHRHLHRVLS